MPRLIVVSNRVASFGKDKADTGGLATALKAALGDHGGIWFGWSGEVVDHTPGPPQIEEHGQITRATIDIKKHDFTGFYAGFANSALWPLLHYRTDLVQYSSNDYSAYQRVNGHFAEELLGLLRPDDVIWVHDYHLFPLAKRLRELGAHHRIGFFLHTPFPPWQVMSTLPVHQELAESLQAYDLIGTQTEDDATSMREFLSKELNVSFSGDECQNSPSRLRVRAFPISVDVEAISTQAARTVRSVQSQGILKSLQDRALVIGVDRLDYTKGLLQRIEAVHRFLELWPERLREVSFLQIAPPSRDQVPEYRRLRSAVEEAVGRLNGQYAEFDSVPVKYLCRSFAQSTLFGFYRAASVGLVTPLRDGMNLVAKEYVACQNSQDPGVLVLSSFAGAAKELDAALIVNPHDAEGVAHAIRKALDMKLEERIDRHSALMAKLRSNDLENWRTNYMRALLTKTHEAVVRRLTPNKRDLLAVAPG
ncbi:trehalose 6-phosphate synthase [Rhodoligotrophos appendicifer]|uniref:alpha,alpha-trehalose-phosphate synthase (UDP-forming) n=1 Tax=Rhodoligotrophos appendicifer TaxID=987056 RepID=UPI0011850DEB|nr:trehalose-6-phosphate synthase [Rhodoligotrophos appendicifer]